MSTETQQTWWEKEGYLAGKEIDGGLWICLAEMIFTKRLMLCTTSWVEEFYCYPNTEQAFRAFEEWSGHGDPIDGWVKHFPSERRR